VVNICIIGASTGWTPNLVTNLMAVFDQPLEVRLLDINPRAAELCAEWGRAANKHHGRNDKFITFSDRRQALAGADTVIITISTGGLDATAYDLAIPEKYGIYGTVGDTAGPGGWSRAIRNIPVFMEFAEDFEKICPTAFVVNYSNPLAAVTATLAQCCHNPLVGLCHSYFTTKDVIQQIFGLSDWSTIALSIAGMNHFTWVVDFRIGREGGYKLLREKIGGGSLRDVLPCESEDEIGFRSGHELCIEFYDAFGYLPYPADRHTCEFVSFAMCGTQGRPERFQADIDGQAFDIIRYCNIKRTSILHRRCALAKREKDMHDWIAGKKKMPETSRETFAAMIRAYLDNTPFTDAVNVLNTGQIPGLPLGCCVETLGVIDGMGVRPLMVDRIPEHLLEIMRPQAVCQKWVTTSAVERNRDLFLQALYHDPQCAHLKPHEIKAMAAELLEANKEFISF